MRLRYDFRAVVSYKNRLHRESGEQVAEHNNIGDRILPQVLHGGTSLNGIGGARNIF